jgi:hypothetical protein
MTNIDSSFTFAKSFKTLKGITLPIAYQTPTFANNFSSTTPSWLHVVAVGDLNSDNLDDVVLSWVDSMNDPIVLISQGDGTFLAFNNFLGNAQRQFIRNGVVIDMNNDGWLDIVGFESTHSGKDQSDIILINNQGKSFTSLNTQTTPTQGHHGGAIGDFNSDGKLDVLGIREFGYSNYQGTDLRSPLIQQNDGTFKLDRNSIPSSLEKYGISSAKSVDLNHDGIYDLILGLETMSKEQLGSELNYDLLNSTPSLAIAYGIKDTPISNWQFLFLGKHWIDKAGFTKFVSQYGTPSSQATAGANSLATLDINQDGNLDIVVGSYITEGFSHRSGGFQVYINNNGQFIDQTSKYFPNQEAIRDFSSSFNFQYFLEDLNSDGINDFVVTTINDVSWPENSKYGSYPSIYIGQKDGTFLPVDVKNMRVFDNTVVGAYGINNLITGDFNGDGAVDLLSLKSENSFDWNIPNSSQKTGYVLVSHLNQAIQIDPATKFTLIGTASNDSLQTSTSKPILRGLAGNDDLTGLTTQIDSARFYGNSSNFSMTRSNNQIIVKDNAGSEGIDTLKDVDRIIFSNSSFGFDIDGNAGVVAKILGAVFGKESVSNKSYVGIGLSFLDAGWTYDNLAGLALDAAGAKTNDQIVSLLWTNVIGSKPTAADKQPFIALLENGMSAGALAHLAADTSFNTTNINLVGLAQTGIEYIPVS